MSLAFNCKLAQMSVRLSKTNSLLYKKSHNPGSFQGKREEERGDLGKDGLPVLVTMTWTGS